MIDHDRVIQHATAIEQLRIAEADVKKGEDLLANFQTTLENRVKEELRVTERQVKNAEENLANLRGTLENRRKAVAKFEAGEATPAPNSPAAHVARFNELPRDIAVPSASESDTLHT